MVMAALSDSHPARLVELRQLAAGDLNPLLDEETVTWRQSLDWDFQASAGLVRRFLDMQALSGFSLLIDGQPVGYSYYVCEERKGLIGDLYVMRQFASPDNEAKLLSAVLDAMVHTPSVRRIESQLMMLRSGPRMPLPYWRYLRAHSRNFMELDLAGVERLPASRASQIAAIDNWSDRKQDEAASLIASAYQGHVDSEINDQYRSPAGARRFLLNIVQYPGCGSFFPVGSCLAIDTRTHQLCGISLASLVAEDVGHITQICVSKAVRGEGVGYELLRRSLQALARHGCRKASLTVTAANTEAIRLYERVGFRTHREFAACVWEGF
jgi:ribosomal protein S18 acetylase RimI-like enzyme